MDKYIMNVNITIPGSDVKKDAVVASITQKLRDALAAGQIEEAQWSVSATVVPEGGVIK